MKFDLFPSRSRRITLGLFLLAAPLRAADWPHWLGPNSDNRAPADAAFNPDLTRWKVAWKAGVGHGYSSVAVSGGRAFTLGHDGASTETVFCFDAVTGALLWKFDYPAQLMPVMHPGGPNATPTVVGERVITVSKDGQVFCLSADKGAVLWRANLVEALGMKPPQWGFAGSPLVQDDRVLFSAGKVVALDLSTGKSLWKSPTAHPPGYTTTVLFELGGKPFIAALDGQGLSILSAANGAEITRHPFKAMFDMNATTPVVTAEGKRIFISNSLSSETLDFDGQKLSPVWTSTELKNAMNNSVLFEGMFYGIDGRAQSPESRLVSVRAEDGKINWAKADFGYGNTIGIGGVILALTENGELITLKPSPEGYREISRSQVLGKLCWTPPTYAGNRIYARNDRGDVLCLSVP